MYGELPKIQTSDGQSVNGFPVQILRPAKLAVLRLPTNDELMNYLNAQRSQYRDLGRQRGESVPVLNPKADRLLFDAIRIDKDGIPFDESESLYALNQITRHRTVECVRDGDEYLVKLATPFDSEDESGVRQPTLHKVSIPFQRDLMEYQRSFFKERDLGHGLSERRFPPQAPVSLYDKVLVSVIGYVDSNTRLPDVPPHHKSAVVVALVTAIDALDPDLSPNS